MNGIESRIESFEQPEHSREAVVRSLKGAMESYAGRRLEAGDPVEEIKTPAKEFQLFLNTRLKDLGIDIDPKKYGIYHLILSSTPSSSAELIDFDLPDGLIGKAYQEFAFSSYSQLFTDDSDIES